jgi:hypothetical protein
MSQKIGRQIVVPLLSRANGSNVLARIDNVGGAKSALICVRRTVGASGAALSLSIRAEGLGGEQYVLGSDALPCEAGMNSVLQMSPFLPTAAGVSLGVIVPRVLLINCAVVAPSNCTYEVTVELQ